MADENSNVKREENVTNIPEDIEKPLREGVSDAASDDNNHNLGSKEENRTPIDEKHRKKRKICLGIKIIVFILVFLAAVGTAFYYLKVWEGRFDVSQNKDTFELGSEYDLKNTLKYDVSNILQVYLKNDGGFDVMKPGKYTVTFILLNDRRNVKEISYEYQVVDSVVPTLEVNAEEIYLCKGDSFDIYDYASAEDLSGVCAIETEDTPDMDKAGDYTISVYAKDFSGNISESESIIIHVADRDDCDFRNAKFGEDPETIKRYEKGEFVTEMDNGDYFTLVYNIDFYNHDAFLSYHFNEKNELAEMIINVENGVLTGKINAYEDIVAGLVEKYGETIESVTDKTKSTLDDDTLLWLQEYMRSDKWQDGNTVIETLLYSDRPNEITLVCLYTTDLYQLHDA